MKTLLTMLILTLIIMGWLASRTEDVNALTGVILIAIFSTIIYLINKRNGNNK